MSEAPTIDRSVLRALPRRRKDTYEIRIVAFGPHHSVEGDRDDDADRLARELFLEVLEEHGHDIIYATFELVPTGVEVLRAEASHD